MSVLSVLVVDDLVEMQTLIAAVVRTMGHTVTCASSGREAAKLLRTQACDLLIVDILMPDGDGLELINELRRTNGAVRILAISGGGTAMDPSLCLRMAKAFGAHATLNKPFDADTLKAGVAAALA